MILYPAIDLKEGHCVRLIRGDMDQATVFNDDPVAQAASFVDAGASWLHLVDLDGAFAGKPMNAKAVQAIVNEVDIPVQLGGGIRTLETIESWLNCGVMRVILGTVAVKDPDLVTQACRKFPGQVAVGIDARGGRVAVEGWAEETDIQAVDLARKFADAGVDAIIYTDIDRDGVLEGANIPATAEIARAVSIPVIASGGVSSLTDIRGLIAEKRIAGAIIGRALYDGRIDLRQALKLC
jgi:phosphoribosylformimino-5-aminoimidazole carboxamide ribotide isomerase